MKKAQVKDLDDQDDDDNLMRSEFLMPKIEIMQKFIVQYTRPRIIDIGGYE